MPEIRLPQVSLTFMQKSYAVEVFAFILKALDLDLFIPTAVFRSPTTSGCVTATLDFARKQTRIWHPW